MTWAQVADPENKETKALKEANKQLARRNVELETKLKRMEERMATMQDMLQQLLNKQQKPQEPMEEADEPPPKRKNASGGRARRADDSQEIAAIVETRFTALAEELMKQMAERMEAMTRPQLKQTWPSTQ